jgi:cell division protein FtsA
MKKVWALDFGFDSAIVAVAETKTNGELRLLGGGESPAEGNACGDLERLGDVTESVVSALRKAEKSSGLKCRTLFFNMDDFTLENCSSTGSKILSGEGQIRFEDVQEAMASAMRMVGQFEKSAVYSCATGFLIDAKDSVTNPVGVFGRQLDVTMHALLARAEYCERWQQVIDRSHLKQGIPVLSVLSSAYGVLSPEEHRKNVLLWDLGRDYLSAVTIREGSIRQAVVLRTDTRDETEIAREVSARSKEINEINPAVHEMILTGDLAEKDSLVECVRSQWKHPVAVKTPWGVAELRQSRQSSLVGLLRVAAESRRGSGSSQLGKNLFLGLRQKAVSLINEYF